MDWDLFKYWLNEISDVIVEYPLEPLNNIYLSMSGYYQKHKDDENE